MARFTNDLKRMYRVSSILCRAVESCFSKSIIHSSVCSYEAEKYIFKFSFHIFNSTTVTVNMTGENIEKCMCDSIENILYQIDGILNDLKEDEVKCQHDFEIYGKLISYSPALSLTSALMFKKIIEGIKI